MVRHESASLIACNNVQGRNLVQCGFVVILCFFFQNRVESSFQAVLDSISDVTNAVAIQ